MTHFSYRNGMLHADQLSVAELVATHGSPLYVYSASELRQNLSALRAAFGPANPLVCYSVKSCGNLGVLRVLANEGAGMDIVSGGELQRALAAGVSPDKIVFAGVGKSRAEMAQAVAADIFMFNVESHEELQRLQATAAETGKRVRVALRVNVDVADPQTHTMTATGGRHTKFGIPIEQALALYCASGFTHLDMSGLHVHLGSPVPSTQTYLSALDKVKEMMSRLQTSGHAIRYLNIGGGFPVSYVRPQHEDPSVTSIVEIGEAVCKRLAALRAAGLQLIVEPGRVISATAGILVCKVEYLKQGWDRRIAILDAGMNALIRPTLYGAYHAIWPVRDGSYCGSWAVSASPGPDTEEIDVVGPICETGDAFALKRRLPPLAEGDLVAIFCSGAYGMSQASQYNSRPRPAEILVDGNRAALVRRRETYSDLLTHELNGASLET